MDPAAGARGRTSGRSAGALAFLRLRNSDGLCHGADGPGLAVLCLRPPAWSNGTTRQGPCGAADGTCRARRFRRCFYRMVVGGQDRGLVALDVAVGGGVARAAGAELEDPLTA